MTREEFEKLIDKGKDYESLSRYSAMYIKSLEEELKAKDEQIEQIRESLKSLVGKVGNAHILLHKLNKIIGEEK